MKHRNHLSVFFIVTSLVILSGCAWFGTKDELPAEVLAANGMDLYDRGKYRRALETFQKLKDGYPFSRFNSLAELKIADAHYHLEEYEEAIFAYQEFQSLHPQNEAIPYVIYQVGRCYFDRMDTVDRDQAVVRQAQEAFLQLVSQFPESPYATKAQKHIDECRNSLAGHEMYVGKHYYKAKQYRGALGRFQRVLSDYPNSGFDEEAQQYLDRCRTALEEGTDKISSQ